MVGGDEGTTAAAIDDDQGGTILSATHLRKVYGGAVALADGSLEIGPSEIHALVGENGAGKSTLIRCLGGTPPPDAGRIVVQGVSFSVGHTPADAAHAGLGFIHQDAALVDQLSVEENIALTTGYARHLTLIDWRGVHRAARDALERMGVELDPKRLVAELPPASRMMVAIARALAQTTNVLVLDEPTANLSARDVSALFRVLRSLRDRGAGILYVTHRLDEVSELCDRITVLRDGYTVGSVRADEVSKREVVKMICGRDVIIHRSAPGVRREEEVLSVSELQGPILQPISFDVAPGELLGFTGMSDAGHYELGELLFGVTAWSGGEVELLGAPFRPTEPKQAIDRGVAYVPPDRNAQGVARELSLLENLFMNPSGSDQSVVGLARLISPRRERDEADALLRRFLVKPAVPHERVSTLSGGNAQKVLVARWLRRVPTLLVVNDVTVGVDVSAREEIYQAIREIADAGSAVIVVTSDFEEIAALCSRAFVLQRGYLIAVLAGGDVTVETITARAVVGGGEAA